MLRSCGIVRAAYQWRGVLIASRVETEGLRAGQTTINMDYSVIITYRTLGKRGTARESNNMAGGETGHHIEVALRLTRRSPFLKSKKAKTAIQEDKSVDETLKLDGLTDHGGHYCGHARDGNNTPQAMPSVTIIASCLELSIPLQIVMDAGRLDVQSPSDSRSMRRCAAAPLKRSKAIKREQKDSSQGSRWNDQSLVMMMTKIVNESDTHS
ncbi:hypothetical protein BDV10DRAFT_157131 [Aspergillus recurvatus]